MNLLPMVGVSALAPPDHPWPEFDLFDNLSSPPSWVSEANTNTTSAFPMEQAEQPPQSRPFDLPEVPCTSMPDPSPPMPVAPASQRHFKPQPFASELPLPPVPSADIVDSALDFVAPTSPVLSDMPMCAISQPQLNQPSITAVNTPAIPAPYRPQPVSEQVVAQSNVFPVMPSMPLQPPAACTSSNADSCTSQGSTSSNRPAPVSRPLPVAKVKGEHLVKPRTVKGKQTRRYSAPKSSRYCHLCARHQRCVQMVPCGNVELGLCQKSVCQKCIEAYNLEVVGPSWSCPHCQNNCPKRAKCFAYDRQTARRREKTLRAKMNSISAAVSNAPNVISSLPKQ